jgi:hypothetical protein
MASTDFETLAKGVGGQIIDRMKTQMGTAWGELKAEAVAGLEAAAVTMGRCKLLAAAGKDVAQDIADVEAQMANWTWTGASIAKRNFWLAVLHVTSLIAQGVGTVVGALASAALARMGIPTLTPIASPPIPPGPQA